MQRRTVIFIIIIVIAVIALYKVIPYIKPPDKNYLVVSGRVEADEIELAARLLGRLKHVYVRDGVEVAKGDVIALVEDDELRSRQRELNEEMEGLIEKINAAEFDLRYTAKNVEHTLVEAEKTLSVAEARLKQAHAKKDNAEKEFKRYSSLLEKGAVSVEKYDNIKLAYKLAEEEADVASKEVERARVLITKAKDSEELVRAKEKNLLALRKSLAQLKEIMRQVEIHLGYTKVIAPLDGIILRKVAEPGEVLQQGGVVGIMINPDSLYVKTYVPEKYVGMIYLNMQAKIVTDSFPDQPFIGSICYISDKAEFTPKEVQSYEERVKQVFEVKICFPDKVKTTSEETYKKVLKKGMPVDVIFNFKLNQVRVK